MYEIAMRKRVGYCIKVAMRRRRRYFQVRACLGNGREGCILDVMVKRGIGVVKENKRGILGEWSN